jgi:FkbM family methyltransferase
MRRFLKRVLIGIASLVGLYLLWVSFLLFMAANTGPTDPLQRIRELTLSQFTASKELIVFPVPLASHHIGLMVIDRRTDRRRLVTSEATFQYPQLSRDGKRLLAIRIKGGISQLLSCEVKDWKCRVAAESADSIINPVELDRDRASGLTGRVDFFACALSDASHVLPFNYVSLASASSGSQFGHTRVAGASHDFKPVAREMLAAVTVDELIAGGTIKAPNLVKIDVDGNEIKILQGMKKLLAGKDRPRAVQVELNIGVQEEIASFLADCGYALAERHHTRPGARRLKSGIPLEKVAHNAIFRPHQAA